MVDGALHKPSKACDACRLRKLKVRSAHSFRVRRVCPNQVLVLSS